MLRFPTAVLIATIGTLVLYGFASLLEIPTGGDFELVGSPWDFGSAVVGALAFTLLVARPGAVTMRDNVPPATGIVFGTLASMSIGHALEQVFVRHQHVIPKRWACSLGRQSRQAGG